MSEYAFLKATKPPVSKSVSRSAKVQWYGLNMNAHADSGYIVDGENFYVTADGTLRAVDVPYELKWWDQVANNNKPENYKEGDITPLGFMGIDGKLFFVYNAGNDFINSTATNVDIVRITDIVKDEDDDSYTCDISHAELSNDDVSLAFSERSLARYNVWTGNSDVINGKYKPRLIIYPDEKRLPFFDGWTIPNEEASQAQPIQRYKIVKTVATRRTIVQETYNDGWSYKEETGEYDLPDSYDGRGISYDTSTEESVYGYADEKDDVPEGEKEKGETTVSYSVSKTMGSDGKEFEMLTVETVTSVITTTYTAEAEGTAVPDADFITAHGNRIFGVNGTKIFASAAGSYVNYDLDTATDFDENNAWYSATQSGGDFTHICTYGGRPVAFKADMLYELYNSKNPYRPKEISKIGAFSGKSVHEVDSTLFYANKDGIYAYGGSYPYCISDAVIDRKKIAGGKFKYGVAGSHEGRYFIREPLVNENDKPVNENDKPVLVFDTATKTWSVTNVFKGEICYFAECDGGLYAALDDGKIYRMDTGNKADTVWYFETPVITEGTADRKVLEKIQLVAKFRTAGSVSVSVKYDNGEYKEIGKLEKCSDDEENFDDEGNFIECVLPLYCKIRKSDHVVRYIRFDCEGDVELLTFEQFLSQGGDR